MSLKEKRIKVLANIEKYRTSATAIAELDDATTEQSTEFEGFMSQVEVATKELAGIDKLIALEPTPVPTQSQVPITPVVTPAQVTGHITVGEKKIDENYGFNDENAHVFFDMVQAAGVNNHTEYQRLQSGIGAAAEGLQQQIGSKGGFIIPKIISTQIWDGVGAQSNNLLSMVNRITLPQMSESIEIPASAEVSRATGSRSGGTRGHWIAEGAVIPKSNPTLRSVRLEPQELAVLVPATNKFLRNGGPAAVNWITSSASNEIDFLVGLAIFSGDGVGKPKGILNHESTIGIGRAGAGLIAAADIDNMWARMLSSGLTGAVWFINRDIEPQLQTLKDDNGNALFRPGGTIAGAQFDTLKNRPIISLEYSPTLGAAGDIMLVNLGVGYSAALKGTGVRQDVSTHVLFESAQSEFRFMFEVDGRPMLDEAITPFSGTNKQSFQVRLNA